MLAADLADIYGYEHKAFNRQVSNNIERFTDDFRFRLTEEEVEYLRCNFYAANISPMSRVLPYVFTEQGIYMLMTILKGDLAVQQSIALIRLFKQMKDYVVESCALPDGKSALALAVQTGENTQAIGELKAGLAETQETLSSFMAGFAEGAPFGREYLIMDGMAL